jgi:dUTP pyrophosphatase
MEIQVRPRSGLAAKHGITVLNSPGTIDRDYRGELMVILINHGDDEYTINEEDKIAQMVISGFLPSIPFYSVDDIDSNTERGSGGFNSTGYN